jgi:DNA (cytosine-5)-methyltransferase 1
VREYPVSADADTWKSYEYLAEKESKDRNAGKGFRRQLLSPEDDRCGTIGRSYNKARSTEPFLKHPTDGSLSRLFTPGEHARLKGIPESVIHGLSATTAHEVLGQSVIYPAFVAIAQAIARHLLTVAGKSPGQVDVAA